MRCFFFRARLWLIPDSISDLHRYQRTLGMLMPSMAAPQPYALFSECKALLEHAQCFVDRYGYLQDSNHGGGPLPPTTMFNRPDRHHLEHKPNPGLFPVGDTSSTLRLFGNCLVPREKQLLRSLHDEYAPAHSEPSKRKPDALVRVIRAVQLENENNCRILVYVPTDGAGHEVKMALSENTVTFSEMKRQRGRSINASNRDVVLTESSAICGQFSHVIIYGDDMSTTLAQAKATRKQLTTRANRRQDGNPLIVISLITHDTVDCSVLASVLS